MSHCFTAIQWILVQSQIWQREVKERLKLHNLYNDHLVIRSELKYLTGAKFARTVICNRSPGSTRPKNSGFMSGPGNKPAKTERFVLLGGSWPGPKPGYLEPFLTLFGRLPILRLWMAATNWHLGYTWSKARSIDALLKLIFRMGQWLCCLLFCQERLPVCLLWIVPTTSPFNYRTYNTENHWRSVNVHFNVRWSHNLLPLIFATLNIWTL
jgi:hypothetical protein